jgi:hypothetical protein
MAQPKIAVHVKEEHPLKWAKGWNRTAIGDRKAMKAWKKPFAFYLAGLAKELSKIGATELVVTLNEGEQAKRDPGVTIYFWKPLKQDFSWQLALGIDNPAPTLDEIDSAYRKKSLEHHPDRLGEKATQMDLEIFKSLAKHRDQARAWVMGTHRSDRPYSLPCDKFEEPRWNLNALRIGVTSIRKLDDYGLPGLLERVAQPELLAQGSSSEEGNGDKTATA